MSTVDNEEVFAIPGGSTQGLSLSTFELPSSHRSPIEASKLSLEAARELADSSGRRIDAPVRKAFVRPMTEAMGAEAPMAKIYSGGRSGVVALKLYLALLWRCSAPPFSTDKPARAWATMLDLEDPEDKGVRRIKAAMRTLADHNLIDLAGQAGYPNIVTLRDESGSGAPYGLPSSAYSYAKANSATNEELAAQTYFKVPQRLWTEGYLQTLKGPGLVMLLILLAEQGGEGVKIWFSTEEFPKRYNISHKTRAAGTKELVGMGLLTLERESLSADTQASVFDARRKRNVYRLTSIAQTTQSGEAVTSSKRRRRKRSNAQMKR